MAMGDTNGQSVKQQEGYLFALVVLRFTWKVATFRVRGGEAAFNIAIASTVNLRRSV